MTVAGGASVSSTGADTESAEAGLLPMIASFFDGTEEGPKALTVEIPTHALESKI